MKDQSRYVIGIDLGTTNSCVSFVDCDREKNPGLSIRLFPILQASLKGVVEAKTTLPSFCYLSRKDEFSKGTLDLPWAQERDFVTGVFAQEQGGKVPSRLVQSAKSWLCNRAADRRDKILPCEAGEEVKRLSPVEATAHYLRHIKDAWNHVIAKGDPKEEFEQQEIILTVPASFDEVARSLTVEAAKQAGFVNMTLLEEPQAAFYHWISDQKETFDKTLKLGDQVVVCDVGGGTCDFSHIEVKSDDEGALSFHRMAVGRHLLLGGDNMDGAICHYLEGKFKKEGHGELDPDQWLQMKHHSRVAKEYLLQGISEDDASYVVTLQGSGSSVVSGSISTHITRGELESFLLDGFFPIQDLTEAMQLRKGTGVRTMGLPYESEPSITKHLATFLHSANLCGKDCEKKTNYLLFNGGCMKPLIFKERILSAVAQWSGGEPPAILPSDSLDTAVARGAAYFGKVRRGLGCRIGGGSPRGYYLAIDVKGKKGEVEKKALTLLPRGTEEGSSYEPDQQFWMTPNTPVLFEVLTSNTRLNDKKGQLVPLEEEDFSELLPLHTILRFGKKGFGDSHGKVPVSLGIKLSEIGTLDLWLKSVETEHKWNLSFQLRNASGQDDSIRASGDGRKDETFDSSYLEEARQYIKKTYSDNHGVKPTQLMNQLEGILEKPKDSWAPSSLRELWEALHQEAPKRGKSSEHEARWWNLTGFCARPGFGYPLDDFRIKELWKIILGDYKKKKDHNCSVQRWICFRRIAGGLNKGQQMQLAREIIPTLMDAKSNVFREIGTENAYEYAEKIRALGSMELLERGVKERLGNALIERIYADKALSCEYWALARIGARHLIYGSVGSVVSRKTCSRWVERLIRSGRADSERLFFVFWQLARKVDQRELNLQESLIERIKEQFSSSEEKYRFMSLVNGDNALTKEEEEQVFGDQLPSGLSLSC
ncbi:MAG: hypothetical protein ACI8RA_000548 [Chlamydiales bacterium]|jgi:hypothetical protein